MERGWTGGQFSLLRASYALLAASAALQLRTGVHALPIVLLVAVSVAFGIGLSARLTGLLTAASLAAITVSGFSSPSIRPGWLGLAALVGVLALLVPPAPYGSLAARGRTDPAGSWRMPAGPTWAASLVLAGGLALAGIDAVARSPRPWSSLLGVTSLIAVVLIAWPRTRDAGWLLAGIAMLAATLASADLPLQPMLLGAWLLAFEPRWLPPRAAEGEARLFYDGSCGLCHGSVRLMLAESPAANAAALRYAPLGGPAFERSIPAARRAALPDSIVLIEGDGTLLTRSRAATALGRRLGGLWRLLAELVALLPGAVADAGYDLIAAWRRSLAPAPDAACPVLTAELRARFDD